MTKQRNKLLGVLLLLGVLALGLTYLILPSVAHSKFSTSYEDYPLPQSAPVTPPEKVVEVAGTIRAFDINSTGEAIAIATSKGLSVYDLNSFEIIHEYPMLNGIQMASFSPDGKKLAVLQKIPQSFNFGFIYLMILDTSTWQVLYAYQNNLAGYLYSISNQIAWHPHSQQIAIATPDQGIVIWSPEDEGTVKSMPDFIFPYGSFGWSADGTRLISTEPGYGLRRWNIRTDEWVRLYDAESQTASQVQWSPNNTYIASGHFGGTVCMWNVANNQCDGFIRAHFNSVDSLAWSADSQQIATASGAIRIWDAKTGEEKSAFGFVDNIHYTQLEWITDQTTVTLESSYIENIPPTIKFWNIATEDVVLAFRGWQELNSPNYEGVTLQIDDVQISKKETLIQTSLFFDYQNVSALDWDVKLKDDKGKTYLLTRIADSGFDNNFYHLYRTIPLPKDRQFTLELSMPRGLSLIRDISEEYSVFYFDPSVLKIGETFEMNQEIYASEFLFYITQAEKISENEIRFDFFTSSNMDGARLDSPYITGNLSNQEGKGRFSVRLTFSKIPQDPFEIKVDKIYYKARGPWIIEFDVSASMFK